jgi:hypothetical protein
MLSFRSDGVQPHTVHTLPVPVKQQLSSLVGLITIEAPLPGPSSRGTRNLFNTFNTGNSRVDVRIASKIHGQTAAENIELAWGRL